MQMGWFYLSVFLLISGCGKDNDNDFEQPKVGAYYTFKVESDASGMGHPDDEKWFDYRVLKVLASNEYKTLVCIYANSWDIRPEYVDVNKLTVGKYLPQLSAYVAFFEDDWKEPGLSRVGWPALAISELTWKTWQPLHYENSALSADDQKALTVWNDSYYQTYDKDKLLSHIGAIKLDMDDPNPDAFAFDFDYKNQQ